MNPVDGASRTMDTAANFGLAAFLLVGLVILLGLAIWKFSKWFGPLARGVIEKHMALVDTVSSQSIKQTEVMGRQEESLKAQTELVKEIHDSIRKDRFRHDHHRPDPCGG